MLSNLYVYINNYKSQSVKICLVSTEGVFFLAGVMIEIEEGQKLPTVFQINTPAGDHRTHICTVIDHGSHGWGVVLNLEVLMQISTSGSRHINIYRVRRPRLSTLPLPLLLFKLFV